MLSHNETKFILLGFPLSPHIQTGVFIVLLFVYILSLFCNLAIVVSIHLYQHLKTPMYYFLGSLASLDFWFISSTVPNILISLVTGNKAISKTDCLLQFYSYVASGGAEFYQLALMSLDRYLAICHPLRYTTLMTNRLCWRLIIASWIVGILELIPALILMSQLKWCSRVSIINHFFCDGSALLKLSCSDTYIIECMVFGVASFAILISLIPTICSYFCILLCIFKISSSSGRRKTFSTCSSHLMVVMITYGCCIFIYIRPAGTSSSSLEKTVAVLNSILSPFLNPFIYTLRNQMFKSILTSLYRKRINQSGNR